MHPIKTALNTLCHELMNIKNVLECEKPDKVILFDSSNNISNYSSYLNPIETCIYTSLCSLVCGQKGIVAEIQKTSIEKNFLKEFH